MLTQTSPHVFYELHGTTGSPVLLIMGLGMRGALWRFQVPDLAEHHRLCTYDHPSIGESESAEDFPTTATLAAHALRLMDEIGWDRAHVVGMSLGGGVAQELALAAPERVLSLSLIISHPGGGLRWTMPSLKALAIFLRANLSGPAGRVPAVKRTLYPPRFLKTIDSPELTAQMKEVVGQKGSKNAVRDQVGITLRHNTVDRLYRIEAPTLIVKASRDMLIPAENSDRLHRLIPNSHLLTFEEAGHGVAHQEAAHLNLALLDHFWKADASREEQCEAECTDEPFAHC